MTKSNGIRKTDNLMRKLVKVPPSEIGKSQPVRKRKKRSKKK